MLNLIEVGDKIRVMNWKELLEYRLAGNTRELGLSICNVWNEEFIVEHVSSHPDRGAIIYAGEWYIPEEMAFLC